MKYKMDYYKAEDRAGWPKRHQAKKLHNVTPELPFGVAIVDTQRISDTRVVPYFTPVGPGYSNIIEAMGAAMRNGYLAIIYERVCDKWCERRYEYR